MSYVYARKRRCQANLDPVTNVPLHRMKGTRQQARGRRLPATLRTCEPPTDTDPHSRVDNNAGSVRLPVRLPGQSRRDPGWSKSAIGYDGPGRTLSSRSFRPGQSRYSRRRLAIFRACAASSRLPAWWDNSSSAWRGTPSRSSHDHTNRVVRCGKTSHHARSSLLGALEGEAQLIRFLNL